MNRWPMTRDFLEQSSHDRLVEFLGLFGWLEPFAIEMIGDLGLIV